LAETAALNDRAGVSGLSGKFLSLELFRRLNYVMIIVKVELIAFIIKINAAKIYKGLHLLYSQETWHNIA
jgi:hypothetical protein